MAVYLLGTLDTKGPEIAFLRHRLTELGIAVVVMDTGCLGDPAFRADISREEVFHAAGTSLAEQRAKSDRGEAVTLAAAGAERLVGQAHARGELDGVLGLGGSAGSTIGAAAMRQLPIGVPKLLVSTMASGQVRQYVGDKDIVLLNSIVDFAGINRISRLVLEEAAAAVAGMVRFRAAEEGVNPADKPLIAATMFGVTTPCVQRAREVLEQAGYEVLVFHATGNGGQAMESLIRDGVIAGVLDITTTELADELVGGVLSAGPLRLTAAAQAGIPQVVSVGALDMVNFHAPETVPERFKGRKFYRHNPSVTLMRTTPEENARLGEELATKVARAAKCAAILIPLLGVSALDREGAAFDDPVARNALIAAIRAHHGSTELVEINAHINDPGFAEACANKLLELLRSSSSTRMEPLSAHRTLRTVDDRQDI
jgi:uncharacterized protein (UPF0261 family)